MLGRRREGVDNADPRAGLERGNELGFSGTPPVQTVFEDSPPGSSVE